MVDKLVSESSTEGAIVKRLRDMADGTFAEVVFAASTAGTDLTASATAAGNSSTSATLAGAASQTTYLTGFAVTVGGGTAAPTGLVTVTGTLGGTLNFQLAGPATGAQLIVDFDRPVPASAVNTAIVVNVPALGATTGAVAVVVRGFRQ